MAKKLTIKEKACNYDTLMHILQVQKGLNKVAAMLVERGRLHDRSKLDSPEVEIFTQYTEQLAGLTYDSKEYHQCLKEMKPALDHHYAVSNHHPEHWSLGVNDMSLVDILEMLIDWASSSKRQNNGNLRLSFEASCKRFNIEPQLASILKNTLDLLEENYE